MRRAVEIRRKIAALESQLAEAERQDAIDAAWRPANGGTELPFVRHDRMYVYMFNEITRQHAYYCLSTDLFLSDEQAASVL